MFYWSNNYVVAILPMITFLNESWTKCLNTCFRQDEIWPNINDHLRGTKCPRGCFGQDQMSTNPDKVLQGPDPYPLERQSKSYKLTSIYWVVRKVTTYFFLCFALQKCVTTFSTTQYIISSQVKVQELYVNHNKDIQSMYRSYVKASLGMEKNVKYDE